MLFKYFTTFGFLAFLLVKISEELTINDTRPVVPNINPISSTAISSKLIKNIKNDILSTKSTLSLIYDSTASTTSTNIPSQVMNASLDSNPAVTKASEKALKKLSMRKESDKKKPKYASGAPLVYTYRLNKGEDDTTCILMTVDAMFSFLYVTKLGEEDERDMFLPSKVTLGGDCSDPDMSTLIMKWGTYELTFQFSKTLGGERWFVKNIRLDFDTSDIKTFNHIKYPNAEMHATTSEENLLFLTPAGNAYKCHREIEIILMDPMYKDVTVKLLLRELTLQPFIFKNANFGPEYSCSASGGAKFRSETLPFVFGSLLAFASVMMVMGYALYRYFKVSKVQYDTME